MRQQRKLQERLKIVKIKTNFSSSLSREPRAEVPWPWVVASVARCIISRHRSQFPAIVDPFFECPPYCLAISICLTYWRAPSSPGAVNFFLNKNYCFHYICTNHWPKYSTFLSKTFDDNFLVTPISLGIDEFVHGACNRRCLHHVSSASIYLLQTLSLSTAVHHT